MQGVNTCSLVTNVHLFVTQSGIQRDIRMPSRREAYAEETVLHVGEKKQHQSTLMHT
jgi:hypothetical protein